MKTVTSRHLQPLWVQPVNVPILRPLLNVEALLALVKQVEREHGRANGKKREAPSLSAPNGPRKRLKMDPSVETIEGNSGIIEEGSSTIPVYCHSFELQYTTTVDSDRVPASADEQEVIEYDWLEDEKKLKEWIKEKSYQEHEAHVVNLGKIFIKLQNNKVIAYNAGHDHLLTLPFVDCGLNMDDHDFRIKELQDPLVAFLHLEHASRAEVEATLTVTVSPSGEKLDQGVLPFSLFLEVTASLVQPAIFEPVVFAAKSRNARVEDAQRLVLSYVFPAKPEVPASFHGGIDIPLLFSIVGPAPSIDSERAQQALQPAALIPTLLPFQRRSVAWLLSLENQAVSNDGQIVPRSNTEDALPLFWEHVTVADGADLFINRISGRVSPVRPKESRAMGGILAEEPGLGKTLECIALILLNPSIGRNPTIKSWDPNARLEVKEVKTTLIVTPASLAPQWADELAQHAPNLKVLIYDGWTKVTVPITETDVERAREQRAKAARKAKAKAARTAAAKVSGSKSTARNRTANRKRKRKPPVVDSDVEMDAQENMESDKEDEEHQEDDIVDWCNYVNSFDVCITTYHVLQQDLGVARPPPVRPRRANVEYTNIERPRSPLVMCEWYRVIMDEVQMVGGGNTEEMVSLIPRVSSFAVSGTPARAQVADLIHVLRFLRVTDVLSTPRAWLRLLKPAYVNEFVSLFQTYAIRTTKASVKDELTIPRQTRYLVPIELGRVERHVYDGNFESALLEFGLDARGVAVTENWEVDTGVLRTWLRRLRGFCTHPQVGQLQSQADKLNKPGVLKSIGEVLEGMRDQNWRNFMEDRRNKIQALTLIAQLQQHDETDLNRYQHALDTLLTAEKEALNVIADIQTAITDHHTAGKLLKEQAASLKESINPDTVHSADQAKGFVDSDNSGASSSLDAKGKGKALEQREDTPSQDSEEQEDKDLPRNSAGEEHAVKQRALQQRLRECQITLHKVFFLKGDVYHVLGISYSDAENEAYSAAEDLRRVLLKGTEEAARRAMAQLVRDASTRGVTEKELYIKVPYCGPGGIRSSELMEEANEMIDELLNEQSALLWKWRTRLVAVLTQPLSSGDEDADGQEYSRSLDTQGEAEAYLQAYAALLADRREALTSERTLLAAHDDKEKKVRRTKAAAKAAAAAAAVPEDDDLMQIDDAVSQPEHEVLRHELQSERKMLSEDFNTGRALRSVMVDLNNIAASIPKDTDPEKIIAKEGASTLRALLAEQAKLMEKLQSDSALLRRAFNDRISYFRQLQELSDTVAEAAWDGSVKEAMGKTEKERIQLDVKINTGRARQRYLDHLAKTQEGGTMTEDEECCILCKCEFTRGYITQCAHVFCEACMKSWLQRKEGRACPVCRLAINPDQLQRFAVTEDKPQDPPPKLGNNESAPKSRRVITYNMIDSGLFQSVQMMESHGSYGSKIQTLIRHLLYIEVADPGSKTIIFSAWADSLHIIEHALKRNGISCLRIDQRSAKQDSAKRFRTDPSIRVLLLHGERENAGLNVTCASRVILVESVVNHAFEIQAIARIDRMGQTKPTEVYCYYAEETVERNILDLAARQGQSLYTQDNFVGTVNVNPLTLGLDKKSVDAPTKKARKGDFVFKTDDMLAIFFPHLFEDLEYLLPPEQLAVETGGSQPAIRGEHHNISLENAVAGPSRLR